MAVNHLGLHLPPQDPGAGGQAPPQNANAGPAGGQNDPAQPIQAGGGGDPQPAPADPPAQPIEPTDPAGGPDPAQPTATNRNDPGPAPAFSLFQSEDELARLRAASAAVAAEQKRKPVQLGAISYGYKSSSLSLSEYLVLPRPLFPFLSPFPPPIHAKYRLFNLFPIPDNTFVFYRAIGPRCQ